ncbi:SMP-30/gluconolactonase/LRE family protein [Streptomyces sp. HMX87]|uniref:SMP-30/gluconolactonase/LRE family protein n=1 Tax=Streptomyces sp. HMX87 TaxID=3390849 RepID=UPI003A8A2440
MRKPTRGSAAERPGPGPVTSWQRRLVLTTATALALTLTPAPAPPVAPAARASSLPDHYVVPGDRAFPTGLALDPRTGHFYVGSAQDGTLYRGHLGSSEAKVWSPDGQDGRSVTAGMTVDRKGRLYVNGADTGTMRVYDTGTRELLAELRGARGGFMNDVTVADDGTAYITDSFVPVVYRARERQGRWTLERWLDVEDTAVDWIDGQHNLNGVVAVGNHLLTIQSNTGRLWRIDRSTGVADEVDLGGRTLLSGDGMVWQDGRLYVTQGNLYADPDAESRVAVLELDEDLSRGRQTASLVPPGGFRHPSAAALTTKGRLLVVNSQYDRWSAGLPPRTLPFTISSLRTP